MNKDRYNMEDTPESADERECIRTAAMEREIDRADYERDARRDREMEDAWERQQEAHANPIRDHAPQLAPARKITRVMSILDELDNL